MIAGNDFTSAPLPLPNPSPPSRIDASTLTAIPFLRLLQLASPTLPIGAFAYSQGLEQAVTLGWVHDEASALAWIRGVASQLLARLDVPMLAELYRAWSDNDLPRVRYLSQFLHACRESAEIAAEDRQLGGALARLLDSLGISDAAAWVGDLDATFATSFSLAAVRWELPLRDTALAYAFAWSENQVAAASRLVPIGHLAAQRVLSQLVVLLPDAVLHGLALDFDAVGFAAPGLAIASAHHETAYTRLFRS